MGCLSLMAYRTWVFYDDVFTKPMAATFDALSKGLAQLGRNVRAESERIIKEIEASRETAEEKELRIASGLSKDDIAALAAKAAEEARVEKAAEDAAAAKAANEAAAVKAAEDADAFLVRMGTTRDEVRDATLLVWSGKSITDVDCKSISHLALSGDLAKVTYIDLAGNTIGAAGCTEIAHACASDALPSLTSISLQFNLIGDGGCAAVFGGPGAREELKAACEPRGITVYL